MKELVVQQFFEGYATVAELAADAIGAFDRHVDSAGVAISRLNAVEMNDEFQVSPEHIAKLIDAVLAGELGLDALDAICFCLEASDTFLWDTDSAEGERVAESLFWLGSPEINYELNEKVLGKIKHYLLTGENTLSDEDVVKRTGQSHLLTVNQKLPDRDV